MNIRTDDTSEKEPYVRYLTIYFNVKKEDERLKNLKANREKWIKYD